MDERISREEEAGSLVIACGACSTFIIITAKITTAPAGEIHRKLCRLV
jgi:hypothetical protein